MKLSSLFGVAVATSQFTSLKSVELVLSQQRGQKTVIYTLPEDIHPSLIDQKFHVENFLALRKSFVENGQIMNISKTTTKGIVKTVITFNSFSSRVSFMRAYRKNIVKSQIS